MCKRFFAQERKSGSGGENWSIKDSFSVLDLEESEGSKD